jgi:hypothetical protein
MEKKIKNHKTFLNNFLWYLQHKSHFTLQKNWFFENFQGILDLPN